MTSAHNKKRKRSEAELEEEENARKRRKVEGINSLPHEQEQSPSEPTEDSTEPAEMDVEEQSELKTYTMTMNGCTVSGDAHLIVQYIQACPWLETGGDLDMEDVTPEAHEWNVSTALLFSVL